MKYLPYYMWVIITEIFKSAYGGDTNLDDQPRQKTCHDLTAVRKTRDNKEKFFKRTIGGKSSMLWKITKIDDYYHQFGEKQNYCTPFHFGPDCKATRKNIQVIFDGLEVLPFTEVCSKSEKEGLEYAISHAYGMTSWLIHNERTSDVLQTRCKTKSLDENYYINNYTFDRMDLLKQDKSGAIQKTPRSNIPEFVKSSFRDFAMIALGPESNWSITRTCDLKMTWVNVSINNQVPLTHQQETLDGYKKEINAKLIELDIDPTTMTDFLPLELPFNIPIPPFMDEVGVSEPWIPDALKEWMDFHSGLSFAP